MFMVCARGGEVSPAWGAESGRSQSPLSTSLLVGLTQLHLLCAFFQAVPLAGPCVFPIRFGYQINTGLSDKLEIQVDICFRDRAASLKPGNSPHAWVSVLSSVR